MTLSHKNQLAKDLLFLCFFMVSFFDNTLIGLLTGWTFFLFSNTAYYSLLALVCIWIGLSIKRGQVTVDDWLFIVFHIYLIIRTNIWNVYNPDISFPLSSIFVYIFFKKYLLTNSTNKNLTLFGLGNILFLFFSGFLPNHFMGVYSNTGVLGGYLLTLAFLILYVSNPFIKALFLTCCFGILLYFVDSRAAVLAFAISLVYHYRSKIVTFANHRLRMWPFLVLTPLVLYFSITKMYHMRDASVKGRVLIWKITVQSFISGDFEEILFGRGTGSFDKEYNLLQASYFKSEKRDKSEVIVADNTQYAFNEYLKTAFENGLTGVVWITLILARLFWNTSPVNMKMKFSLISISVFALFSYPFSIPVTYINFIFIIAWLNTNGHARHNRSCVISWTTQKVVCLVCSAYFCYLSFTYAKGLLAYGKAKEYELYLNLDEATAAYEFTADKTKWFGFKFVMDYALTLFRNGQYTKCIAVLKKDQLSQTSDSRSYLLLGHAYSKIGNDNMAEESFIVAKNITPMKLLPKFYLLKHYQKNQNTDKLISMSQEIIDTGEKVPSAQSGSIIEIAREHLMNQSDACVQEKLHIQQ